MSPSLGRIDQTRYQGDIHTVRTVCTYLPDPSWMRLGWWIEDVPSAPHRGGGGGDAVCKAMQCVAAAAAAAAGQKSRVASGAGANRRERDRGQGREDKGRRGVIELLGDGR